MRNGKALYSVKEVNERFRQILQLSVTDFEEGYLFGSRARGDNRIDSDWDYLIVVDREISGSELRRLTGRLYMEFHKIVPDEPADIIIQTKSHFERSRSQLNHISHEVYKTGVKI